MKVLQIIQKPQLRGAEIFACQLSSLMQARGVTVHVAYLFDDGGKDLFTKFPNLKFVSLAANKSNRFFDFFGYRRLSRLIDAESYSVVQANAGDTLKYAALSKILFRWKTCLIFRNANKMSSFLKNYPHQMLTSFFLSKCDKIISVSENCRLDICMIHPPAKKKAITIPIGTFDFTDVTPIEREDKAGPIFVNIGSLVPEKNHAFLVDVFVAYFSKYRKGTLWFVGGGALQATLQNKVNAVGLSHRVVFWGFRDDAVAILKAADILVMPSKIEGLPGAILESFSCGIPVVAAEVGGIPEVVRNDVTGICIRDYSIPAYVGSIQLILTNENYRSEISVNAKQLIRDTYDMDIITTKFLDFYRSILKPSSDE